MPLQRNWLFTPIFVFVLFALTWPYRNILAIVAAGNKSAGGLTNAASWHYQLDNIDAGRLAKIPADVMVIDYAKLEGKIPLTKEEVARIKVGPDGFGRFVLAYLSVGEAEEFRFYWRNEWKAAPPNWLGEENCAWPKAHRVRFWLPGWKEINFDGAGSYLRKIIEAGFDGVYLDRVDIFETYLKERPTAKAEMISYVRELAHTAWRLRPGFFIVAQNAETLLEDQTYRSSIDGVGKESLLYGTSATANRNTRNEIESSARLLRKLQREGKPVFAVEYLLDAYHIAVTDREMRARALVPTFQSRALDGRNPTSPVILNTEIGTPERTTKECPPGTSW